MTNYDSWVRDELMWARRHLLDRGLRLAWIALVSIGIIAGMMYFFYVNLYSRVEEMTYSTTWLLLVLLIGGLFIQIVLFLAILTMMFFRLLDPRTKVALDHGRFVVEEWKRPSSDETEQNNVQQKYLADLRTEVRILTHFQRLIMRLGFSIFILVGLLVWCITLFGGAFDPSTGTLDAGPVFVPITWFATIPAALVILWTNIPVYLYLLALWWNSVYAEQLRLRWLISLLVAFLRRLYPWTHSR